MVEQLKWKRKGQNPMREHEDFIDGRISEDWHIRSSVRHSIRLVMHLLIPCALYTQQSIILVVVEASFFSFTAPNYASPEQQNTLAVSAITKLQQQPKKRVFYLSMHHLHGQQQLVRLQPRVSPADGDEDRVRPHRPQEVAGGHRRGQEHHVALAQQRGHVRGAAECKEKKTSGILALFTCGEAVRS